MNKRAQTSAVLNALALAGMLVFASQAADAASSQAADAASTQSPSADAPAASHAPASAHTRNALAAADDARPDTVDVDTRDVDDAGDIGDIGNQDVEIPDVGEVELPESD